MSFFSRFSKKADNVNVKSTTSSTGFDIPETSTPKFDGPSTITTSKVDVNTNTNINTNASSFNVDSTSPSTTKIDTTTTNAASTKLNTDLKKYESVPGASLMVSKTADAIKKNPKLAALGISTLAAAGFIVSEMAKGKTFGESFDSLVELVEDVVEDVTKGTIDVTTGIIDAFLKGIFGEDYLVKFKKIGIALTVLILIFLIIKGYRFVKFIKN